MMCPKCELNELTVNGYCRSCGAYTRVAEPGPGAPALPVTKASPAGTGEPPAPLSHHSPGEPEPTPKGEGEDGRALSHPAAPGSEEAPEPTIPDNGLPEEPVPLTFEEAVIKYMEATSETIENFAVHIDAIDTAVRQLGGKVVAQGQNLGRVQIRQSKPEPPPTSAEGIKELLELPLVQNLVTSVSRYLMGSTEGSAYERARATAIDRAASGAASKFDEAASAMFQAFVDGRVIVQGGDSES